MDFTQRSQRRWRPLREIVLNSEPEVKVCPSLWVNCATEVK